MTYQPATTKEVAASHGCAPGMTALGSYILAKNPGSRSLGCFDKRPVRGTGPGTGHPAVWSLHAVGRAFDIAPKDKTQGDFIVLALWLHAARLGVQYIIWNGKQYKPDQWPQPYDGPAGEHADHMHIEMTYEAAHGPFFGWRNGVTWAYLDQAFAA